MQTLVNDNPAPSKTLGLDSLLADYKEPLQVNPGAVNTPQPNTGQTINPNLSKPLVNAINGAEQQFYKTGKKAGQPKPNKGAKQSFTPPPVSQPIQQGPTINSQLISGTLFITLIDVIIPVAISFIHNRFSKSKIESSALKLTPEQRKDLEPLCDQVVQQLNLRANPAILLAISLGGIYVMNFMLQKNLADLKAKHTRVASPYDNPIPKP